MKCKHRKNQRRRLRERDGDNCYLCGCRMVEYSGLEFNPNQMTRDHMTPRSRGGTNNDENMALACARCNSHKGDMTVLEFVLNKLCSGNNPFLNRS